MEIIIVLIIIIVLFGATRLPKAGRGLGKAIGNIKKGLSENKRADVTTRNEMSKEEKIEKK